MQAKFIAELVGTIILILLGNGVVANVVLNKSKGNNSGWMVITSAWGFAVMVAAYITGWVSGAHLNPALSIGIFLNGGITLKELAVYIPAQLIGAFIGAILVYVTYKRHYDETDDKEAIRATFCTTPAIRDLKWNLITEIIGTAVLVIGILGITNSKNNLGGMGTMLVGILIWGIGLSLGGPTGYAINPARDLGPRLAHYFLPIKNKGDSDWSYSWVPIVGPIIGGILGSFIYQILLKVWSV
ncbi:MAG: aquaporin family protein [Sebaldella sp.]|nr:aquaporin family protein [Sebaldella sp.]